VNLTPQDKVIISTALVGARDEGGMSPEEARREVKRLEDERLRLASEVMGGEHAAVAEDSRLEKRIRELASTEREARSEELRAAWRGNHPGEKGGGRGRSG
jgi:hypothetical protein